MSYLQPRVRNLNDLIQLGLDRGDRLVLIIANDKTMYLKLEDAE